MYSPRLSAHTLAPRDERSKGAHKEYYYHAVSVLIAPETLFFDSKQ